MRYVIEDEIIHACILLFGAETHYDTVFLRYLQSPRIKSAFRKKALQTHPDRILIPDEKTKKRSTELFIKARQARDRLIHFCRDRDNSSLPFQAIRRRAPKNPCRPAQRKRNNVRFHKGKCPNRRLFFGEFLYYSGVVPWDDFIGAIVWQRKQRPQFGDIAKHWSYLSEHEINVIMTQRKFYERLGETAVRISLLNRLQVGAILFYQRIQQKPIGEYFVKNGYLQKARIEILHSKFNDHNAYFRRL
jgi:hypothetical protein